MTCMMNFPRFSFRSLSLSWSPLQALLFDPFWQWLLLILPRAHQTCRYGYLETRIRAMTDTRRMRWPFCARLSIEKILQPSRCGTLRPISTLDGGGKNLLNLLMSVLWQ